MNMRQGSAFFTILAEANKASGENSGGLMSKLIKGRKSGEEKAGVRGRCQGDGVVDNIQRLGGRVC